MAYAQRTIEESHQVDEDLTIVGGDDFLAEQGIEDADEFRVKTHLCHEIGVLVASMHLTQATAAGIAGLAQTDISRIVNYRHDTYSTWRLMKVLSSLGADISIAVNPVSGHAQGVILARNAGETSDDQASPSNEAEADQGVVMGMRL